MRPGSARIPLAIFLIAMSAAVPSLATTQMTLKPSALLAGGYDDNLLFNGLGGSAVGRGGVGVELKTWDHLWSTTLIAAISAYGFGNQLKVVPLGETRFTSAAELDRWNYLRARVRATGSDDPLGLAQVGVFGAAGNAMTYRSYVEYEHLFLDTRWSLVTRASYDGIAFFDPTASTHSGSAGGLASQARWRWTRDLVLQIQLAGKAYLAEGLQGWSVAALPGLRYRVARHFFLEADVGPEFFHDHLGDVPLPAARGLFEFDDRFFGARLTVAQDLALPNGHAGVLLMQLIEGMLHWGPPDWEIRARAGYYQSATSPREADWQPGYGFQADAYRRLNSFIWLGLVGMRFQRIATQVQTGMARDAIYLQLELTQGRP